MGPAGGWRTLDFKTSGNLSKTGLSRILIESPVADCAASIASAWAGGGGRGVGRGAGAEGPPGA